MQSQEHEAAGPIVSSQEGERDASWSSLSPSCILVLWGGGPHFLLCAFWTVGWCHPHRGDDSPSQSSLWE